MIFIAIIILKSESGNLTRQWFAHLDRTDNYTFTFEAGYDDNRVFPGMLYNCIIVM